MAQTGDDSKDEQSANQIQQFEEMQNNIKSMIDGIGDIDKDKKANVESIISEINTVCDQMQTFVESLRKDLLQQVKEAETNESSTLDTSKKSLENLLKLVQDTSTKYNNCLDKNEISKEISKCEQEYYNIVLNNSTIVLNNSNVMTLNYNTNDIKQIIKNTMVTLQTTKTKQGTDDKVDDEKINFNLSTDDYSICQFDLNKTKLSFGSKIDKNNTHIKIGSIDQDCYCMVLPPGQRAQSGKDSGYKSGQHCWRMYYKNRYSSRGWLFFGICQSSSTGSGNIETNWGIADNTCGQIYCNGKAEYDDDMTFLYSMNENEIDMFVDFDKGVLEYKIVDDNDKNRKYTFKKEFDASVYYHVNIGLYYSKTEIQIGKINVDMFGKNKKLIKWPVKNYS